MKPLVLPGVRLPAWLLLIATLSFSALISASAFAQTPLRQINAGGGAVAPFAADNGFNTGNSFSSTATINLTGVTNPAPQVVYQAVRWAPSFNYTLSGLTVGSSYLVRLHFVELSFTAAGQRRFNAAINGTSVLTNFDIFAAAGAANKAVVSEFTTPANASGAIVIAFTQGAADNPSIAGIEIYPAVAGQAPNGGKNWTINNGALIQAENYDAGGEGVSYHDTTAGNTGGAYRGDGVDVEACTDTGGGYNVGWTVDGEWLEYTTNTTAGTYSIVVRAASGSSTTRSVRALLDGTLLGTVSIPSTGGWQTWQDFTISGANIPAGTGKVLRLELVGGDFNLNYVRFATTAATFPLTVTSGSGSGNYAAGTVVNIVANAAPAGQVFTGWTGGTAANFGNASSASTTYTTTGAAQTITANYATVPTFALTVNSGTGSGTYPSGTVVNIVANAAPAGQVFTGWTGGTAANFGNASSATTTYTTTGAAQTITANYAAVPTFALTVNSGTGSGTYPAGTVVNITANAAPAGQTFSGWSGGTAANFGNASSATTTYTTTNTAQTITANYTTSTATNLAVGKPVTASSSNGGFPVANANDNSVTTYWESASLPATLTIDLGANANITSVMVKLDPSWPSRAQTIQVLGHNQTTTTFTSLVPATSYQFNSGTNSVTIPVTATVSQVQLAFTVNNGAPGAQAAEFQIIGAPASNPDLTITNLTWTPTSPVENAAITLNATVANTGSAASPATTVNFLVGGSQVGTANVGALNAGASASVSTSIGTLVAGSYTPSAQVDPSNTVIELSNSNNSFTSSTSMVVAQAPGPDLQIVSITPSNSNPATGVAVSFTVAVKNRGTTAVAAGTTTRLVVGSTTLNQTATPAIAAGATVNVTIPGTWTSTNGNTAMTATADATNIVTETSETNNTLSSTISAGRGAIMPYDLYEAEDGTPAGGATVVGPNRTVGDRAGEASGRKAVVLSATGQSVSWTTRASTNTIVVRFSIPDGTTTTLSVFNGSTQVGTVNLVSKYAWLYGNETSIPYAQSGTGPRKIYDEANALLTQTVAAGSTLSVRNTTGANIAVDFVQLELATPIANPDPTHLITVSGSDQQAIVNAINTANTTSTATGIFIPTGDYPVSSKIDVTQKSLQIVGAGPWFTRLIAPQGSENTETGFNITGAGATGSQFKNFALFGNWTNRIDGQGQPFQLTNVSGLVLDNLWVNHFGVMVWGQNVDNTLFTNLRISDTFADGITMANDSQGNTVRNCVAHSTGDDSFALFNAQDVHAGTVMNNLYENLTSICTWRAAGLACYGGSTNTFRNIYIADSLVYSGVTISSLSFNIAFVGFSGTTTFDNISVVRCGGHFWPNEQIWPAVWLQSAEGTYQGIRVSNMDILDPTYMGIMFQTKVGLQPFTDTVLTNVTIDHANTPRADGSNVDATTATGFADTIPSRTGIAVFANPLPEPNQGPCVGTVSFVNLVMTNCDRGIVNTCPNFTINQSNPNTFPLTVTNGTGSGSYASGTVVNIVANAPAAGQVFAGWTGGTAANFGNAAAASTTYTTTGTAQTITATYNTVPTFALTVSSGSGSGNYAAGTVVNIVANPPGVNQVFAGWTGGTSANFGNAATASTTYTTTGAAQTITATYNTVPTFALTVSSGSGSGNYPAGTVVNIVANAAPTGQVFTGWTGGTTANFGNVSAATTTYTTTGAAQTLTANYATVPTFDLTVNSGTGSGTYAAGTVVNITANAAPSGQTFSGWSGGTAANFGNVSSASTTYTTASAAQTITANYTTATATNLAVGKPITASSSNPSFPASNANDNSVTTYWESASLPATLTIDLGANANITSVAVKLNPDSSWGNRSQTIQVLGHNQASTTFTSLVAATSYAFSPSSGNTVTIPVTATVSQVQLAFTANTGAPGGQAAEFQIIGTPAPNPDLTITNLNWTPASPNEANAITLNATVANIGSAASPATTAVFYLGGTQVGTAVPVGALNAGASSVVSLNIGALTAGSYVTSAEVDPTFSVIELNNNNNVFTSGTSMVVAQAPGPDLQITGITPSNSNPAAGSAVSFTVAVNNRGTTAVAAGTTTRLVVGSTTLNQTATPAIAANSTVQVTIPGTWTAVTGTSAITVTADATNIITETNEGNNAFSTTILSGRGAAMPYTRYRAADTTIATLASGATLKTSPNFALTNLASQASGQGYVELSSSGSSVQWTVTQNNVAGVTMRFTLPDSGTAGLTGSVNCIVTRAGVATTQSIPLTSYYAWQYFLPGNPDDSSHGTPSVGSDGVPVNIGCFAFDEVHWLLDTPMNAGDTIRIQSAGGPVVGVDFLEIETVPGQIAQPAGSVSVTSFGASTAAADNLTAFNNAVAAAVASSSKTLYIPAGTYKLSSMWVIGSATNPIPGLTITGAGIWYTNIQFTNSQAFGGGVSFKMAATAKMDFSNMYLNSNLSSRFNQQAVYKCFMDEFGTGSTVHDIWEDHFECGFWVGDYHHTPAWAADGLVISNSRIRNNLADGVNFCQGTKNSTVQNCSIRNNGDDGLAVWPDSTNNAPEGVNNTFTHNTIELIWRSAGIAIYGGSGHKATFNIIKDGFMSAGIRLNGTFPGFHFENNTGITFSDTTITNCGTSFDVFSGELGAVNLEASGGHSIRNLTFTNIDVVNAQKDGYSMGESGGFSGIQFTNCTLNGSGRDGVTHSKFSSAHLGAAIFTYGPGTATFTNFQFSNAAGGQVINPVGFTLIFN